MKVGGVDGSGPQAMFVAVAVLGRMSDRRMKGKCLGKIGGKERERRFIRIGIDSVSYTHLTLPTNREV